MIRLICALLLALALHPTEVQAPRTRQRVMTVERGHQAAPSSLTVRLATATPPSLPAPLAGFESATTAPSPPSFSRRWLRMQRLLC